MHLATAYIALVFAAMLFSNSLFGNAIGRSRGLLWDDVNREERPVYFWISWSYWTVIGLLLLTGGLWRGSKAYRQSWAENLAELARLDAFMIAVLAVITLLLGWFVWRHVRIGPPRPHLAYLKRRYEQRKTLRTIVANHETGIEGVDFDEFAAMADGEWLEEIIAHLKSQSADSRSLKQAIEATSTPE